MKQSINLIKDDWYPYFTIEEGPQQSYADGYVEVDPSFIAHVKAVEIEIQLVQEELYKLYENRSNSRRTS